MYLGIGLGLCAVVHQQVGGADPDEDPPTFVSAVISADGLTLTGTCNEALDEASESAAGQFTLGGTASIVSTVNVTGSTFVLGLSAAVFSDETVLLSYAVPGANPIQDLAGNNLAALTNQAVTNGSTVEYLLTSVAANVVDIDLENSVVTLSSASISAAADLSNAAWTKSNLTVTANVAGTQDRIAYTGAGTPLCAQNLTNSAAGTTCVPVTTTFWASYESCRWVVLETRNTSTAAHMAFFDVQNGVVGTVGANMSDAAITPETRNSVAGYRCSIKTNAQTSTHAVKFYLSTVDTTQTNPSAGNSVRIDDITVTQIRASAVRNRKSAVDWTQATVDLQPEYEATGFNGKPCLRGYGLQYITSTEAAALLADAAAYTLFVVGSAANTAAQYAFVGYGDPAQATARTRSWGVNNTGPAWLSQTRNNANTNVTVNSAGAANTNANVHEWYSPGTTVSLQTNGAAADPSAAAQNPGTLTPGRAGLMCRPASTVNLILTGRLARAALFSANKDATARARIRAKLGHQWGVTVA